MGITFFQPTLRVAEQRRLIAKRVGSFSSATKLDGVPKRSFLSPAGFSDLPRSGTIDPWLIRFSHDSVAAKFQAPHGSVDDFVVDLRLGSIKPESIDPIRNVEKDGMIFTLDNRRLYAFQSAGIDIPFVKLDHIPKKQLKKFTTKTNGESIIIRRGN